MKNQILVKVTTVFIITSYFLGFIIKEDSTGGGQVDYSAIINNFKLFQESDLLKIDWNRYISSALPIYYIISKYIIPTNYSFLFYSGHFSFLISILTILITYKCLCIKNKIQSFNWEVLLITVIPMLSPFFRTSAFWSLEENIGYFFFALTILFYLKSRDEKKNEYLAILFSCLSFYARQNYAFLPIIIFFLCFNIKDILNKKNVIYFFLFILTLLPSLYFFYKWGGLMPPSEGIINSRIGFQRENILIILTNFFLYLFPFCIFLNYKNIIKIHNKKKIKMYIIFFIVLLFFIFIFFNHISKDSPYFKIQLGGGIIYKFIFFYNYWIASFDVKKIFYILIALFGLMLIIYFSKNNVNFFIFSFISIIIFSNVSIVFQEYFDPLIYFSIIFFTNIIKFKKTSVYKKLFFTVYFLLILLVFYYFKIII